MKWLSALLFCLPLSAQDTQEEQIFTDDIRKDFLDKITKSEQAKDWKSLFSLYDQALRRYNQKLVPHPERPENKISIVEYLMMRFAALPPEALEAYRLENDTKARNAYTDALAENDLWKVQQIVDEYFFATVTDEMIDQVACHHFDRRSFDAAIFYWNRLLRYYPDSEIPKTVTATRIAVACQLSGSQPHLDQLRAYLAKSKLDGPVVVGGEQVQVADFVKKLVVDTNDPSVASIPVKLPTVPEGDGRNKRRIIGVRNDIKRWTYDFTADKGETSQADKKEREVVIRRGRWEGGGAPAAEFPYLAAHKTVNGREYVIATNGYRVVAFNPLLVRGENASLGVYWKYPSKGAIARAPINSNYAGYFQFGLPYIGVTIDGDCAIATLYSEKARKDTNPQTMDLFDAPTRLVCLRLSDAKVMWDTDQLESAFKGYDFVDRNFAFSSPPIVKGRYVYAGICTSPMGEQEARVLCLDRMTGKPVWCTFVSSVSGGQRNVWWGNGQRLVTNLTLMSEHGGVLYVATNLGVVAAVDGIKGNILWLATYKRAVQRQNWNNPQENPVIRPGNPPLLYKGVLYVLPQDGYDLLAYDAMHGARIDLPVGKVQDRDLQWKTVTHLLGIVRDWMLLGGAETYVLRMKDYKAYALPLVNTSRCGLGALDGETVYFPTYNETGGDLAVYHGVGSWKRLDQTKWKGKEEYGNLLVAGDFLIVMTNKILVYTDTETLRKEYIARVRQSPPHLQTLLEYGTIMRDNDKLEDAAESYLEFIRSADGDPQYEAKVREVKLELFDIFVRRGDDAAKSNEPEAARKALNFYTIARDFAYDPMVYAETTRKIAASHERLKQWREAVEEYQRLIVDAPEQFFRAEGSPTLETLWMHARKKIDEIVTKEKDAYATVEKEASEALKKIADSDVEALRKFRLRFPNSDSAKDAWKKLYETYLKGGAWDKLRGMLEEFRQWYGQDSGFEQHMKVIELLDRIGDTERLAFELERVRELYPKQTVGDESVKEYVERRLREFAKRTPLDDAPLRDLAKIGEMEAFVAASGAGGLPVGCLPLRPLGIVPPDFPGHYEIFERGSSIELWDLRANRRVWTCAHPGGWLGIVYQEPKDAGTQGVVVVELRKGSPADKAGLKAGDVILEVQGSPVTVATWERAVRGAAEGASLGVTYRRGKEKAHVTLTVAAWPREAKPGIVGAAFTRDYELAVAWDDGIASIELETGQVRWFFSAVRDRFHLASFFATDGRLYAVEAYRDGRSSRPMRVFPPVTGQVLEPDQAHQRLLCVDDFSGCVLWARAFDVQATGQGNPTLAIHAKYLTDSIAIVESGSRPNTADWYLYILNVADGQPVKSGTKSMSLSSAVLDYTVDLESGMLYYVDAREQAVRSIRSVCIDPKKDRKPVEIQLVAKYADASSTSVQLEADENFLCLLTTSPPGGESAYRIWVFSAKDGKEVRQLSLPENRTLPQNFAQSPRLRDGVLYVYNILRSTGAKSGSPAGFLTAYRVGAADVAAILAWDAVAPTMANSVSIGFRVETGPKDFVVLFAARGSSPGETSEAPVAAVYEQKGGGYLKMVFSELTTVPDVEPVIFWRGRLFVNGRAGLQMYGRP